MGRGEGKENEKKEKTHYHVNCDDTVGCVKGYADKEEGINEDNESSKRESNKGEQRTA